MNLNEEKNISIINYLNEPDGQKYGYNKKTFTQASITDREDWNRHIPNHLKRIFRIESLEQDAFIYKHFCMLKRYFSRVYLFPFSWIYKWIKPDGIILFLTFMLIKHNIPNNPIIDTQRIIEVKKYWYRFLFQECQNNLESSFRTIFIGINRIVGQKIGKYEKFINQIIKKRGY